EINKVLTKRKSNATGPDTIHNKMLANISPTNRKFLRHLFNILLFHGITPQAWKEATIIPILKTNKQPNDPTSFHPISLTSCLGKIMERVINNRLSWHLETRNLLQPTQAGSRPGRSTIDHIISLENDAMMGFSNKLSTFVVFLDIAKAYDRTNTNGVFFKLSKMSVKGKILKWIKSFLTERTAKVRVGNQFSDAHTLTKEVPQGAVLSPTLFNVMMSDLPKPPRSITTLTYADDVAIYTKAKTA
ncbi:Pol-like protein, partial [Daphnia magna]